MKRTSSNGVELDKTSLISAETIQTGKEVKIMNYEKPNVALVASAAEAVKGSGKNFPQEVDQPLGTTISAYESDE